MKFNPMVCFLPEDKVLFFNRLIVRAVQDVHKIEKKVQKSSHISPAPYIYNLSNHCYLARTKYFSRKGRSVFWFLQVILTVLI